MGESPKINKQQSQEFVKLDKEEQYKIYWCLEEQGDIVNEGSLLRNHQ